MLRSADLVALVACLLVQVDADALSDAWTRSTRAESRGEEPLVVMGTLPSWLRGEYWLNSASVFEEPQRNLTHVFDGFGKVLRWKFHGGLNVTLRARMHHSNWLNQSDAKQDIIPASTVAGVQPAFTKEQQAKSAWTRCSDNFNVNVHNFGRVAPRALLSDISDSAANLAVVDAETLTSAPFRWTERWSNPVMDRIMPAHPRVVPDGTGDTVGIITRLNPAAISGIGHHSLILFRVNAVRRTLHAHRAGACRAETHAARRPCHIVARRSGASRCTACRLHACLGTSLLSACRWLTRFLWARYTL